MTKCSNFIEFARLETSQGHWAELIFSEDFCKGLLLDREKEIGKYATSTFPIRPLICPPPLPSPPKCITFVFHFSWVLQPSQEESKTMLKQNFGGGGGEGNKVHYGKCGSGVYLIGASSVTISETIAGQISASIPSSILKWRKEMSTPGLDLVSLCAH